LLPPVHCRRRRRCCSKDEQLFLEARLAYQSGKPIMSDAEYEALKGRLAGSGVFQLRGEGPTCSLDRPNIRNQQSGEATTDWAKMVALQLPALLAVSGWLVERVLQGRVGQAECWGWVWVKGWYGEAAGAAAAAARAADRAQSAGLGGRRESEEHHSSCSCE